MIEPEIKDVSLDEGVTLYKVRRDRNSGVPLTLTTLILFCFVCSLVFNATFNNISVISWRSVLLVEETGENHRPVASP
jgi:hypothetical protein